MLYAIRGPRRVLSYGVDPQAYFADVLSRAQQYY